ncbi:dihydrofolate reductase family protein [soil metagenome]
MRKIVAGLFISLDGVIEAPHEWHFPYFNDEMGETVGAQMSASDAMLLGRVTYQEFASFWPDKSEDDYEGSAHMNGTSKFVVSTTLDSVEEWQNSTLVKGDFVEEITKLKEQDGKNIGVTGSAMLVRSLIQHGLLDELHLLVHPIVVGHGKQLFPDGTDQIPLKLLDSRLFDNGVLSVVYGPDKG